MMTCNAQALINISRKRLCTCASKETREVWQAVKDAIAEIDPIMSRRMCRECVYRGLCPEMKSCGFVDTNKYIEEMSEYFKGEQNGLVTTQTGCLKVIDDYKMKSEYPISKEDAANYNQIQQ